MIRRTLASPLPGIGAETLVRVMIGAVSGLLLLAAQLQAQAIRITPGETIERARSPFDSTQHWALFVPSVYDDARTHPILFLMDPRGRAMIPLDRARAAAERYGWIVMSSYNTMSDGPVEPNVRALSAMLDDAQSLLRLDTRRFYLAGFSGTARVAWAITPRLDSAVAGILGAGAGTPARAAWLTTPEAPRIAFFGAAGTTDFNFDEVMGLEQWLRAGDHTYALRSFDGGHDWPPEPIFADAIAWFQLQAMRNGRLPVLDSFVDSLFLAWSERADSLARAADPQEKIRAIDLLEEIARTFHGARDVSTAQSRARELRVQHPFARLLERREELARRAADFSTRFFRVMDEVLKSERAMSADRIARDLGIDPLIRERDAARDADDGLTRDDAQRKLETIFVNTSFYAAQRFLESNRPEHALAVLDVADRIHPRTPRVLHNRARARVLQGRSNDALDDLEAAVAAGLPPTLLLSDPLLQPLRSNPRFLALTGTG